MHPTFRKVWLERVKANADPYRNGSTRSIRLPQPKRQTVYLVGQGYPFPRETGGLVEVNVPTESTAPQPVPQHHTTSFACRDCANSGNCVSILGVDGQGESYLIARDRHIIRKPYCILPGPATKPWPVTWYGTYQHIDNKLHREPGSKVVEAHIGNGCYLDFHEPVVNLYAYMDEKGNIDQEALVNGLIDSLTLPIHRDDWTDVYHRPDRILEQQQLRGIPVEKLRREWRGVQDLIWVKSRQDGRLYLFRWKDLDDNGRLRPHKIRKMPKFGIDPNTGKKYPFNPAYGPQSPRFMGGPKGNYIPNEIWEYFPPVPGTNVNIRDGIKSTTIFRTWHRVGSITEEQASARLELVPPVQMGRLNTVSYLETDWEDDFDNIALDDISPWNPDADYNGPQREV